MAGEKTQSHGRGSKQQAAAAAAAVTWSREANPRRPINMKSGGHVTKPSPLIRRARTNIDINPTVIGIKHGGRSASLRLPVPGLGARIRG